MASGPMRRLVPSHAIESFALAPSASSSQYSPIIELFPPALSVGIVDDGNIVAPETSALRRTEISVPTYKRSPR